MFYSQELSTRPEFIQDGPAPFDISPGKMGNIQFLIDEIILNYTNLQSFKNFTVDSIFNNY